MNVRNRCNRAGRRRRRTQVRARAYRSQQESERTIELIDVLGNRRTIRKRGRLNSTSHQFILAALERRSLKFRSTSRNSEIEGLRTDGTGTVEIERTGESEEVLMLARQELQEIRGVSDEVLKVHGVAPGSKPEGVTRLLYENINGIPCRWANNDKLEKARELHDELEADIVAYNEHRLNMRHKDNSIGFGRLFSGGEADVRSVVAHNVHEDVGKTQEGGTSMLMFGPLIEYLDTSEGSKDDLGLGRWVVMTLRGNNNSTTRIVCGYNPCGNEKTDSGTVYQQHRRYLINKENSLQCPRVRFREDLVAKLTQWREDGNRLIVCLDANEHIYKKSLGKILTNESGLRMKEVVGHFTGKPIGPTYYRGQKPIDGIWATSDVQISGACIMPAGFGIGDHRMFVIDILTASLIGLQPQKIVRPKARRLNTRIPGAASAYQDRFEKLLLQHRIIERVGRAHEESSSNEEAEARINAIDKESGQYMLHAEKKCRRIKSGRIPFSPESAICIRRCQVYRSIMRFHEGKIRNRGNLKRAARRCGIEHPLHLTVDEVKARLKVCREQCEYFRNNGHKYRRKHLHSRLQAARDKEDEEAETAILAIIRRERDKARWKRLNFAMGKQQGRSVQTVQVEHAEGAIVEYTGQEAVQEAIWSNIHQQRFYLAEQAPICAGDLRNEFGYNADTDAARTVLNGTYPTDTIEEATGDIFDAVADIRAAIPMDSINTIISHGQWSKFWIRSKEETSSSRSGRHFGFYKAGAGSEIISHYHAVQTSIVLQRGIKLNRWAQGLSVMLEKVAGCSLISKLRSILLMEADFNCANKILFGGRMLDNVRHHSWMPDEIFSEKHRMAEDGTLAKVLFYDLVRQSRRPAGLSSVDADNCYDRIAHAITSLVVQAFGVPQEAIGSMLKTIQEMQFFLRTAYGDSESAAGSHIEVKTQGLCQGNGAAPAGWAVVSITILHAHKKKGHGMKILCPISKLNGHVAAILYVDDTDVIHLDLGAIESTSTAHFHLQESVLSWGKLLIATGGALKPSKCFYHLISFDFDEHGQWSYAENHEEEEFQVVIPLPDGTTAEIEHLSVFTPHKTLGSMTSPADCGKAAIEQMQTKAQGWMDKARQAQLSRRNFWFLMERQFRSKVGFGICSNTSSVAELRECLQKIYWQLVPLGGLRSSVKRELRQLATGFYGGGCLDPSVECAVAQVNKLLMHYGCNTVVGLKLQASMEFLILELGISDQPFQLDYSRYEKFVTAGWLKSIWEKAWTFQFTIELGNIKIRPPREGDAWLMVELRRLGVEENELLRLNRVRIHQQVLFLSDVLDARGNAIDKKYLTRRRDEDTWSNFTFPVERPPDKDFRLWNRAIYSLGANWRGRGRMRSFQTPGHKIWDWRYEEHEGKLYHLKGEVMDVYAPSQVPGFANRRNCWSRTRWDIPAEIKGNLCTTKEVALAVQAIVSHTPPAMELQAPLTLWDALQDWGCCWMWESLQMIGEDNWIKEAIADNSCMAVTDGSYIKEIHPELCATAFIIECSKGRGRMVGSFAEASSVANAYRGELLGLMQVHLILLAVQATTPHLDGEVLIYSDCLGALGRVSSLPPGRIPSRCKHSDILKNILVNCSDLTFERNFQHVKAHQDDKASFEKLDRPSQLNCAADEGAKREIWQADINELPRQRRFPLEPICCFIGKEKMTSDTGPYLRFYVHKQAARSVFDRGKVLNGEQFDLVAWKYVSIALDEVPRLFQLWACKQVFNIAGTNGLRSRWTEGLSKRCPSCRRRTETSAHVLYCDEAGRVDTLLRTIDLLGDWLREVGTDPDLRHCLVQFARSRGNDSLENICQPISRFRQMARVQDKLGWRRFLEGMITQPMIDLQYQYQTVRGSRRSIKSWASGLVIKLLEITHGQWLYRNVVVHDAMSGTLVTKRKEEIQREIETQQAEGLQDLQEEDQYLLEINLDDLEHSSGERQEYWLLAITAARKAGILARERNEEESSISDEEEAEYNDHEEGH